MDYVTLVAKALAAPLFCRYSLKKPPEASDETQTNCHVPFTVLSRRKHFVNKAAPEPSWGSVELVIIADRVAASQTKELTPSLDAPIDTVSSQLPS